MGVLAFSGSHGCPGFLSWLFVLAFRCSSNFGLLCNVKGIIQLNSQITHSTFQLGVTKQQLDSTQVLCAAVN
jgi:hypothetical protein